MRNALRGQLHTTPCQIFKRVLNLGCGPGSWVIDFADQHPDCEVIGVDVVPIQPEEIPPNATFECDDILTGLNFPDNHFDMIAASAPLITYTPGNLHIFFREVLRMLKPGGYVNSIDFLPRPESFTKKNIESFNYWCGTCLEFFHSVGLTPDPFSDLRPCLEKAGFANITEYPFMIPGGTSPRESMEDTKAAELMTELTMLTISTFSELRPYQAMLGLDDQHIQLFMSEVRRETLDPEHVWQSPWMSMVAQKPDQ